MLQDDPDGPVSQLWAKSPDENCRWLRLFRHLDDTAAVASALWTSWVPETIRRRIAVEIGDDRLAQRVVTWLGAVHDAGKASAAFQGKLPAFTPKLMDVGFNFPALTPDTLRLAPHGTVGMVEFREWLCQHGFNKRAAPLWANVVGGHHGTFPRMVAEVTALGMEAGLWADARRELFDRALLAADLSTDDLVRLGQLRLSTTTQVLLTGFLIVCDWVASNADLMPYADGRSSTDRAISAIARLNFPPAWLPMPTDDAERLFARRFELPPDSAVRPVQHRAVELAWQAAPASLMIIEAPTGEGKTEAALAAAEVLAARSGSGGIFLALPTRATTDAMFSRVLTWLEHVLPPGQKVSTTLAHGKAHLNEEFEALMHPGGVVQAIDDDARPSSSGAAVHWWLRSRKKALLASFAVGTIDQVLALGLRARHLVLRHLGLAGKVVVLDEIHAADDYMAEYLVRALEWLGAASTPVITLSATLPPHRREELLAAYQRGLTGSRIVDDQPPPNDVVRAAHAEGYPLISIIGGDGVRSEPAEPSGRTLTTTVSWLGRLSPQDIASDAVSRTADGGCLAVVLDTVDRAQQVFAQLRTALPDDESMLVHSRLLAVDRNDIESTLRRRLGPNPQGQRPHRLIVVATQVIEQSLDVDFDAMISDIAPMDLLIQRMGRVHRHRRDPSERPAALSEPTLCLTAIDDPTTTDGAPVIDGGPLAVYGESALLRAAAVMRGHGPVIESPGHIAELVRTAYDSGLSSPFGWDERWRQAEDAANERRRLLQSRARTFRIDPPGPGSVAGWTDGAGDGQVDPPAQEQAARAQVRDADDALEVVVVQRRDGQLLSLGWLPNGLGGQPVDLLTGIDDVLARGIAACTVTLPAWTTRSDRALDDVITALEQNGIDAWQQSPHLKGTLPLILDEDLSAQVGRYLVHYDRRLGLTVTTTGKDT